MLEAVRNAVYSHPDVRKETNDDLNSGPFRKQVFDFLRQVFNQMLSTVVSDVFESQMPGFIQNQHVRIALGFQASHNIVRVICDWNRVSRFFYEGPSLFGSFVVSVHVNGNELDMRICSISPVELF